MLTMKILLAKICILTFVIVPAVWTATTATSSTPSITTTTAKTLTITNDSNRSHAPDGAIGEMNRNEKVAKTLAEIQIGLAVGATLTTTTTTTSTATPTTTATTSTTTAATTTTGAAAATAASNVNGNEAGRQISNGNSEIATATATTTSTTDAAAATKTVTATTTDEATTATDKLMTTNVPPLASLGSVFDRLYRIKLTESETEPAPAPEPEPEPNNSELDADHYSDADISASRLEMQMQAAKSYQVAETLADLNEDERKRYGVLLAQQPVASKLNIVDLYPLQMQEFQPNYEQLHTVFTRPDNADEYRQNLMPNEVEMQAVVNQPTTKTPTTTTTPLVTATGSVATTQSYFTGKLLAEQDDLITEIERKFQLQETTTMATAAATTAAPSPTTTRAPTLPKLAPGDIFIDRRAKKSFEFPMQHRASDVMALPHIDFANTKFNTDANDNPNAKTNSMAAATSAAAQAASASHPEFSTTKFYNSKEMYNEMLLLHKKQKLMKEIATTAASSSSSISSSSDSIIKSSRTTATTTEEEGLQTLEQQRQRQLIRASETTKLGDSSTSMTPPTRRVTLMSTEQSFDGATTASSLTSSTSSTTSATPTTSVKPRKYEKELKRAKLLLKALTPPIVDQHQQQPPQFEQLEVVAAKVKITTTASTQSPNMERATHQTANLTKSPSKPIARPRILSRLQEKINSLECDIPNVPQDSHLWRGNETHELLLPLVTTEHCKPGEHCAPNFLMWEGEAEIQSGDILIVEINDAMLNTAIKQNSTNSQSAAHAAQVYQVTRSGHEHCDVTEGVLLDITPLVVDGRKLVTLYDKDLTEGVNLLIVVSELWGAQCVRLKVTTKTDNCGENADCSGKGICYSNGIMEEYECQCCSGFAGPHCEEIDACNPSPCTNNGICVDLSQGHEGNSYQCLCPYGYAGKNCQYESDPCNPTDCMNGGSCVGNSTHFRCDCTPGYTGPVCQHSLNECESSPCVHGICVDQEDGFRCFCQPGFAGELCNFEYNECESNPCQNNGECIDHIGSYECRCTKGYLGNRCQMKVDFCANKPCPEGHRCIDHGNDFSCECPEGRNGPDCNQMPRTYFQQCSVNPCTHGGTCWSSGDSFYCACRPGYTGTMCEDEFVVETVVSSSEFIVDDVNARNFNDKTFGSSAVLKSPIELHNAYFAAGVLAAAIFIVAVVVTICHCNVNQTYRKFSTRSSSFIPILGFSRRPKLQGALNKHWLSGKGLNAPTAQRDATSATSAAASASLAAATCNSQTVQSTRHLSSKPNGCSSQTQTTLGGQMQERPFQRHMAMNFENDMYYTVDFAENSQNSPLIQ